MLISPLRIAYTRSVQTKPPFWKEFEGERKPKKTEQQVYFLFCFSCCQNLSYIYHPPIAFIFNPYDISTTNQWAHSPTVYGIVCVFHLLTEYTDSGNESNGSETIFYN